MITHAYVPDEFVEQIPNAYTTCQKKYEEYVTERINGNIKPLGQSHESRQHDVHVWQQDNHHQDTRQDGINDLLLSMTREYDQITFVVDTYTMCLLNMRLEKHAYMGSVLIHDETHIKHITMKRFLSHDKTNADLADYLAMKVLSYNTDSPELVITSSSGYTISNGDNHEETDTLMIHHAVLTSRRNPANASIVIFSPDTDVHVLADANHHLLLQEHIGLYGIRSHRPRPWSSY